MLHTASMAPPRARSLLPLAALLAGCGPTPTPVVQDAAFLVPLSQARSFIPGREVLPRVLFDRGHALTVTDEPADLYEALGTVGVRLDPCFREGLAGECQPQLRLVLQPVFDEAGTPTTRDAALHLFFRGTKEEVLTVVQAIALARGERGIDASGHPTVSHPGFGDQAFRTRVKSALRPFLSADRLVRVTMMGVHASNEAWMFSGLDLTSGSPVDIPLPTLAPAHEHHVTSTGRLLALEVTLDPAPVAEPAIAPVVAPGGLEASTAEQREAAAAALRRLEDPAQHNPGTVDCASCHVAALSRAHLERAGVAFPGTGHLAPVYQDTRNLRAFGYLFTEPAASPRLLRESDEVLDAVTKALAR